MRDGLRWASRRGRTTTSPAGRGGTQLGAARYEQTEFRCHVLRPWFARQRLRYRGRQYKPKRGQIPRFHRSTAGPRTQRSPQGARRPVAVASLAAINASFFGTAVAVAAGHTSDRQCCQGKRAALPVHKRRGACACLGVGAFSVCRRATAAPAANTFPGAPLGRRTLRPCRTPRMACSTGRHAACNRR